MRAASLLIGLMLLTAGCLGLGGDDAEDAQDDVDDAPEADGSANETNDSTSGGTSDHGHEAQPEKHWDNKTGEVQGTNVLVESQGEAVEETTEVPEAALEVSITLSAEEGEIRGEVYPPGCEEQDEEPGEDCSHSLNTYDSQAESTQPDGGNATWSTQEPDAGTWTIRLWKADAGNSAVPYTLTIWFLEEHEPAPGHHS